MYIHFDFIDGGNPYITTTNKRLFEMLTKYDTEQTSPQGFTALSEAIPPRTYREKQDALRNIAIAWQSDFPQFAYSWGELANWGDFFTEMGKKYGLLREFKENAII